MRAPTAGLVLLAVLALPAAPSLVADDLRLPAPGTLDVTDLLTGVGARPDRVLRSVVPGDVRNDEVVRVAVDGSGTPVQVQVEQRLQLSGTGDSQVRERGPARSARALGEEPPPVTKFGAVVWQGFSPGARELAALLTLDPALEEPRLPLLVRLSSVPAPARRTAARGGRGPARGAHDDGRDRGERLARRPAARHGDAHGRGRDGHRSRHDRRFGGARVATGPSASARRAALDLLVLTSVTGARATAYAPCLGADLPGTGTTSFRWSLAAPSAAPVVRDRLRPRPGALALAGLAALLVLGAGAGVWRAS